MSLIDESKYQGVKEFHMLAPIGCYCKVMHTKYANYLTCLLPPHHHITV